MKTHPWAIVDTEIYEMRMALAEWITGIADKEMREQLRAMGFHEDVAGIWKKSNE